MFSECDHVKIPLQVNLKTNFSTSCVCYALKLMDLYECVAMQQTCSQSLVYSALPLTRRSDFSPLAQVDSVVFLDWREEIVSLLNIKMMCLTEFSCV